MNRGFWLFKGLKIVVLVTLFFTVFGWLFMQLWNHVVPDVFTLKPINYWQALGLLVISRILFGGRPGFGGGRRRWHWRHRMRAKWERMTPEEREKFRSGMGRNWCQFSEGRRPARASGMSQGSQRP
jgi:hypothetical protein